MAEDSKPTPTPAKTNLTAAADPALNITEKKENKTGPQFTLGDKISSSATPVMHGVVHGFVTQMDGTSAVLIWSDADMYVQFRPDQIQLGHLA